MKTFVYNPNIIKKTISNGFSLIEILIAVSLIGFALLGFAKLQLANTNSVSLDYLRNQAILHLEEMKVRLLVNRVLARQGEMNYALNDFASVKSFNGSDNIAKKEVYQWFQGIDQALPNAQAGIYCDNTALCAISVRYQTTKGIVKQQLMVKL